MTFRDFRVFVFGYRAQNENSEVTENLYFLVYFLKLYQIRFCVCFSSFLLAEYVVPLLNCYFRDFCGFREFQVFDLAVYFWTKTFVGMRVAVFESIFLLKYVFVRSNASTFKKFSGSPYH